MRNPFLATLDQRPLLCDGAMGTLLHERGVPADACLEALSLEDPSLLLQVHSDYIEAGADIIETDTFGANSIKLAHFGLDDRLQEINRRAVEIAHQARAQTARPVFLSGAMGPLDVGLPGGESITLKKAHLVFHEQAEALIEAGVDLIAIETFPTLAEAKQALRAVRECGDLPVMVQLSFQRDGRTWAGEEPGEVALVLRDLGANVIGVNCVSGPQLALDIVKKLAAAKPAKLSAQPNAGQPQVRQQTIIYPGTPQSFGEYVGKMVEAGASIVGGCCGTTPEHIAAMNQALSGQTATVTPTPKAARPKPIVIEREPPSGPEPQTLREKLAARRFVVTVEADPPRGLNFRPVLEGAALLKDAGVDCLNVGDSPMARTHMSAVAMAVMLHQDVGVETIVHFVTRDRNLIALEADLIGGHALGLRNVLCLRGDPPRGPGYQRAIGVWDVGALGLIRVLKGMNEGVDASGNSIGQPASFFVGAAANPMAPVDAEMKVTRRKLEAGADFLLTQPVFDVELAEQYLTAVKRFHIPVILGIMPLYSHRHTEFIHHELAGVTLPDAVRERMRLAGENGLTEGMRIALELLEQVRDKAAGVCLMPSFGRFDVAAELAASIKR
ncbi:MAG TPA: bifunctional homocysteine S-methyltransferase/methylenetetrahydrofolate reductase [Dehalococcoidia bacterium]|nr:bifunctional homocysteine S-methyltransferase/methylenetetrahydrofolate reductase [Dehalococcoidia bacterium]